MSKVFVCYSHKDKEYFDLINKHISINKKDIDIWSDTKIKGGDNWREKIQKALDSCNLAVLILSTNFFNSDFIQDVELKQLLKNEFEKSTKLLPILLEDCDIEAFSWIETNQILPSRDEPLETLKKKLLKTKLKDISQRVRELLAPVPDDSITKENVKSKNYPDSPPAVNNFPESNDDFFGREKYFDILDKAWGDEQVNILSFIAFGGIGKTSLIDNWLKRMKESHYKGAKNIFMWSFYSQGSEEDRQVTATEFLLEACKFFKLKKIPKTAYEQGRELADIISKQRALIVLDGLEPLQSSLEDIGEIKDNGLQVLLKRLSRQNKGLVVVTSRIKLASIDNEYIPLEKLEDDEGAELLKSFELNGTQKELEKISNDFDGHALALKLLGSYTKVVLEKDINRIDEIENLTDAKDKSSKHANRMLNSYKKYLKGTIELDILKLLGFFDRAISFEVINVLKNKPLLENINDKLVDVSEVNWKYALDRLKQLHLISSSDKVLDTHPLVREYFSKYIEESYNKSYIKGHYRLYKYYEKIPEKEYPDTVEEMEPLFQSIYHACKSEDYEHGIVEIYSKRINRGDVTYLVNVLSRYDLALKLLSGFYKRTFIKFHELVDDIYKDVIVGHVAYALWTLGKVNNALGLLSNTLESSIDKKQYDVLIRNVNNIIDINIVCGKLNIIENFYNKYESYTKKCIGEDTDAILMGSYAYSKFLLGDFENAEKLFLKCEEILMQTSARISLYNISNGISDRFIPKNIYSTMGYMFYKYLFFTNNISEIERRIQDSLKMSKFAKWTLDIGLDYITLGRLKIELKAREKIVLNIFNKGIEYLRKSNEISYITEGLIQRAKAFRHYKKFKESNEELQEAYDLIIRSEAKLLLADWYIVAIKLALDENDIEKANTYFKEAKALSQELDKYFIFKEELKKLEANFNIEVKDE